MAKARAKILPMVMNLKNTLELASMFEDTDSADDRQRVLKNTENVISEFFKLVNDCYRLELHLRFKTGKWQSMHEIQEYDNQVE